MFELTGRLADGWAAPIPSYLPYEDWRSAQDRIDAAACMAGRDPGSIRRIAQIVGTVTSTAQPGWLRVGAAPIAGDTGQWVDVIGYLTTELRFDSVIFWPEKATVDQIEIFAFDVVPHVRSALATVADSSRT